jgi:uncharacterized SAM-binding protein YcdF (DUF218 family)
MTNPFPGVIVVLGAPNDDNGALSRLAVERCDRALDEFRAHPDHGMMTVGGWGAHFNTTAKPHGWYSRNYLIEKGVPESIFLPIAESGNTIQDAELAKPILQASGIRRLRIVTSDFHVARARFCFEREFPGFDLVFCPALTRASNEDLQRYRDHEVRALARLKGLPAPG